MPKNMLIAGKARSPMSRIQASAAIARAVIASTLPVPSILQQRGAAASPLAAQRW
jgi:hypothetical protein